MGARSGILEKKGFLIGKTLMFFEFRTFFSIFVWFLYPN